MSKKMKTLLIEDSNDYAELIKDKCSRLKNPEIDINIASRLDTGIVALLKDDYDVIIANLHLPDSSGLETVRSIRKKIPHLPVIVLTSLDDEKVALEALNIGAQDYLIKSLVDIPVIIRSVMR